LALRILKLILGLLLLQTCFYAYSDDDQFVIRVGDTISIKVYNELDLTTKAKVGNTGVLKIPLIGEVLVVNKTPQKLSSELEAAYLDGYLVDPSVSVVIESYRPFYVRGAVSSPGVYDFDFDMNVEQALALAKGLKDRASKREWYIIRGTDKSRVKVTRESRIFPGDILEIEESLF
jgi:polysaccharide export outer membrane protein